MKFLKSEKTQDYDNLKKLTYAETKDEHGRLLFYEVVEVKENRHLKPRIISNFQSKYNNGFKK